MQSLIRPFTQIYFPDVYDIKYLMKFCSNLHGGLNKLAETLEVERVGPQHQVSLMLLLLHSIPTYVCCPPVHTAFLLRLVAAASKPLQHSCCAKQHAQQAFGVCRRAPTVC